MPVRDDFWENLQRDLMMNEVTTSHHFVLSPSWYRVAAVASVALVLGVASIAFWLFSPQDEREKFFQPIAVLTPETTLNDDRVDPSFTNVPQTPSPIQPPLRQPSFSSNSHEPQTNDSQPTLSVRFSITMSQRTYEHTPKHRPSGYASTASEQHTYSTDNQAVHEEPQPPTTSPLKARKWALKAYLGTSLPKEDFRMPLTVGFQVERLLGERWTIEAGLQYNRLYNTSKDDVGTLHTLAIPIKANYLLAGNSKVDFYALAGGAIEKCVAGTSDNSFRAEPVQLSVNAGLGLRYKLTDRLALFAEPSVSYHFDTDSPTRSLYTERPTNFNLLCGVRMIY